MALVGGGREQRHAHFAEGDVAAQAATHEEEGILGGELLVRVEDAQASIMKTLHC